MSSKPKQAPRMARPAARYWAGKAPKNTVDADSDSDEEEHQQVEEEGVVNVGDEDEDMPMKIDSVKTKSMNIALRDVNISKDGKVIVAGREESGKTTLEEDEEESEEDVKPKIRTEEEESEESSEYESESEEEKPKLQFRPVFVSKRNRETVAERDKIAQDSEEALKRKELELEERRKQSHDMVAESIRRELAESQYFFFSFFERLHTHKEKEEQVPDVDDTDGLDPKGEFEAWRLRELGRIKKEKEEILRREQEREEIERRRAMPEEQRLKEDLERAQKLRDEKPKGQQKFLQKYWHKGAFHQDAEILKRHDFTEATESTVDVSLLPKVMQIRNFGKRSQTKYTHLLDQDTTIPTGGFGGAAPVKAGGKSTEAGGCFICGGPHMKKDCPQNTGPLTQRHGGTGANAGGSGGTRQWGGSWKERDRGDAREGNGWRNGSDASGREQSPARDRDRDPHHRRGAGRPSSRSPRRRDDRERYSRRRSRSPRSMSRSRSPPRRKENDERSRRRPRSRERPYFDYLVQRYIPRRQLLLHLKMPRTVKVAVVGSGLAGLTAAYMLSSSSSSSFSEEVEFEVHVFEKSSILGMDSSSISLPVPGKREWRIDVPMRSFQGGYYNKLISLYKHLGISFKESDFSYSFSRLIPKNRDSARQITADMIYNGNSGAAGVSMPSSLTSLRKGKTSSFAAYAACQIYVYGIFALVCFRLLILYVRILILSIPVLRPHRVEEMTFRAWSEHMVPRGFLARWTMLDIAWVEFTQSVLVPLFSAVCTAPENSVYEHPVEEFLDYIWLTLGFHHFVALNGVREVVAKLVAGIKHIHLSSPLTHIEMDSDEPTTCSVHVSTGSGFQVYKGFHHLIFATQANRAVPLLESFVSSLPPEAKSKRRAIEDQLACLRQFKYCSTLVINHTDPSLIPDDSRDKRELNLIYLDRTFVEDEKNSSQTKAEDEAPFSRCLSSSYTMATHVLTPPQGYPSHLPTVYQTTNPIVEPRESRILSVASLERAVLTVQSKRALKGLNVEYGRRFWQSAGQGKSKLGPLQGARPSKELAHTPGVWICGSFAHSGIPLLEGCVVSARNVVEQGIWRSEGVRRHITW
ncbi:hypothetical protein GYMLUDRAFT_147561 [Collybiopsis luxurians FD-317 M1]|nr:hypothetical protein GYMLUDRAFT_147561 [Collybiopsis luxurians FD-317 M1]